jgi:hypothetical protein
MAIIVPPVVKPCEPLIGAYALTHFLRRHSIPCMVIDSNLEWFQHQLWGRELQAIVSDQLHPITGSSIKRLQRAVDHVSRGNSLRNQRSYQHRDRYQQSIEYLQTALGLGSSPTADEEPGLADFRVHGLRPVLRRDLVGYCQRPSTVFDDYLERRLLPKIAAVQPDAIGFSLTFLHQSFATMRMAAVIRRHYPRIRLILGGALVECWQDADWSRPPFNLFDAVISLQPAQWRNWERIVGSPVPHPYGHGLFPDPEDLARQPFFAPEAVFPMAFGLGCAWGRCTFCPDYHRHPYQPAGDASWVASVERMLSRHPALVIHLTDSCVPPVCLDQLARLIRERHWPVRWYAFVRLEKALLEPGRLESWARGGCGLLEFGLETASPELLKKMQKGIAIAHAAYILRQSAAVGIRNTVYLLFGFPGETAEHQSQTLDFVLQHQDAIHYLNNALFNLPKGSPIAEDPSRFGIRSLCPMPGEDSDLSLYLDFVDQHGSARQRARSFVQHTLLADPVIRQRVHSLPPVFKSNHAIFAGW